MVSCTISNGMKKTRVAINGFGRIGRAFLRSAMHYAEDLEIVAINDLSSADSLAYLLKYDSVYGQALFDIEVKNGEIKAGDWDIKVFSQKDPASLPWKNLEIDVVVESTGFFTEYAKAKAHVDAGAKHVVISAPAKGDSSGGATVLMGVNEEELKNCTISSNASCTTNAASPLVGILEDAIGIERAMLNTVHGYTSSQALVDGADEKDLRRGRAAAINIVPTSTGAAKATTKAHTGLDGKFDGIALRVPVAAGSVVDVTFVASKETTVEEVNAALSKAAGEDKWEGIFGVTDEPLVSTDIIGLPYGAIADLSMTRVVDGTLVKVLAWYDNEMGYTHTLVKHVLAAGK